MWVQSLGREDPLEEGMAAHSSILAWKKLHGQRNLVGYGPWGPSLQGPGSPEGNTEGPGTASSEPLLPS